MRGAGDPARMARGLGGRAGGSGVAGRTGLARILLRVLVKSEVNSSKLVAVGGIFGSPGEATDAEFTALGGAPSSSRRIPLDDPWTSQTIK